MKDSLLNLASKIVRGIRRLKHLFLILIIVLLIIALMLYVLKLIEPASAPQNILVSNVTDRQATVSWTTAKPTRGLLVVSEDGNFPLLPTFAKKTYKDDGEKKTGRERFYTTHHATISDLAPNKTYQYLIYQGWKKMIQGKFTTGSTLASISVPNPVYGRVLSSDKKPMVGAIVYFQADTDKEKSALLSTLTNIEGRWNLDLGNLRTKNLKFSFKIASKSAEAVVVEGANKGKGKAFTSSDKDKPWPDIILK